MKTIVYGLTVGGTMIVLRLAILVSVSVEIISNASVWNINADGWAAQGYLVPPAG